jgi:hypothetical protein
MIQTFRKLYVFALLGAMLATVAVPSFAEPQGKKGAKKGGKKGKGKSGKKGSGKNYI